METTRLITGRRITARTVRDQKGLCSRAATLLKYGIRSALARSPSRLSSAGRSVSAAATETNPAAIAPAASPHDGARHEQESDHREREREAAE